ncbi:MAG: hypothetical protein R3F46_01340 [bacterium]
MASGVAMLAILLAGGCGGADATDLAQAGRMPAPAEVAGNDFANELPGSATGTEQEGGAEQAVSLEADTSTIPHSEIDLDAALHEIAALEAPADVDADMFGELKAELGRLLEDRETEGIVVDDSDLQAARRTSDTSRKKSKFVPDPFQIRINRITNRLSWHYILDGDYDQNGIVNAADLVPLAGHLGEVAGEGGLHDYFEIGTVDYVIDRNGDGFITPADLTAIAVNFGRVAGSYQVFASEEWHDVPWKPDKDSDYIVPDVAPLGSVTLAGAVKSPGGQLYFDIPLTDNNLSYLWVLKGEDSTLRRSPVAWPGTPFSERYSGVTPFRIRETELRYESAGNSIGMLPILPCDGDRNGAATVADITPIGIYLGKAVGAELPLRARHIADYDQNGVISLEDLWPLQILSGSACAGFALFHAASASQLPDGYWGEELNEPVLTVLTSELVYPKIWDFQYLPEQIRELPFVPEPGSWMYLRPVSITGNDYGPVCEFVQVP